MTPRQQHIRRVLAICCKGRDLVARLEASIAIVKSEGREQYRKRVWEGKRKP